MIIASILPFALFPTIVIKFSPFFRFNEKVLLLVCLTISFWKLKISSPERVAG
jgi:hypothetical protein